MDIEFNSIEDLYNRVRPALYTRVEEFNNIGYSFKEIDIWNYLKDNKWKDGINLTLFDIVSDIFSVQYSELLLYVEHHEDLN